eukprot:NODE_6878_length_250_cov_0.955224_g6795_i0.p2 GENE.NODE_6878_length_250_cov_0.955224_g6795_i0~~NODE_6878_length_250_cov_0.955224_g6795_i0.p2  ORF type:complete len:82 (+),score=27.08 NODE_6878_length_250_cov_0.955224_g6795_i0:3-248(+)
MAPFTHRYCHRHQHPQHIPVPIAVTIGHTHPAPIAHSDPQWFTHPQPLTITSRLFHFLDLVKDRVEQRIHILHPHHPCTLR